MKPGILPPRLLLLAAIVPFLTDCATPKKPHLASAPAAKEQKAATVKPGDAVDELDDYGGGAEVSDPFEGLNRFTFKFNDKVYDFVLRPVSKGYEFVAPKPVRQGLSNFFDNVKFPVRFVNNGLQGKFKNAGKEVGKFGVNTIAGFGGFIRQSDKIPSLAAVTNEDTGQTLGKWGIGHGPYMVLPIIGPSTARDTLGFAGDYALNPVHWGYLLKNGTDWVWIPTTVNTIQSLPDQLWYYDESCKNSVDPYLSVRSIYVQNRNAATAD